MTIGRGVCMSISYNNLWKILIDKGMKKQELMKGAGISTNIMAKMGRNEHISMDTLEKICLYLGCDIGDIVSIKRAENIT